MADTKVDRKAALNADTPAQFARAIGVDPKRCRAKLRNMGIRVSENRGAFDATAKKALLAHFLDGNAEAEATETPKASSKQKKTKSK